jgi:hypothetical protein
LACSASRHASATLAAHALSRWTVAASMSALGPSRYMRPASMQPSGRLPSQACTNSSVAFANNTIAVTGRGESAVDDTGKAQSWFDPAKSVTVTFRGIDGKQATATGVLPMFQTIVVGDKEYRFSLVEGERSFVRVTNEVCAFP